MQYCVHGLIWGATCLLAAVGGEIAPCLLSQVRPRPLELCRAARVWSVDGRPFSKLLAHMGQLATLPLAAARGKDLPSSQA